MKMKKLSLLAILLLIVSVNLIVLPTLSQYPKRQISSCETTIPANTNFLIQTTEETGKELHCILIADSEIEVFLISKTEWVDPSDGVVIYQLIEDNNSSFAIEPPEKDVWYFILSNEQNETVRVFFEVWFELTFWQSYDVAISILAGISLATFLGVIYFGVCGFGRKK